MRGGNYRIRPDGKTERVPDETDIPAISKGISDVQNEIQSKINDANNETRGNDRHMRQSQSDREAHKVTELLTLEKLRADAARPLYAEVIAVNGARVVVRFKPRRVSPGADGVAVIPSGNFYQVCNSDDHDLTLLPDELCNRRSPLHLKRILRDEVQVGLRGAMYWTFTTHPVGATAPENWAFIRDDSVAVADVESGSAEQGASGVVESVRATGDGTGIASVRLDTGENVSVPIVLDQNTPQKGTRGVVTYTDGNPVFNPE